MSLDGQLMRCVDCGSYTWWTNMVSSIGNSGDCPRLLSTQAGYQAACGGRLVRLKGELEDTCLAAFALEGWPAVWAIIERLDPDG